MVDAMGRDDRLSSVLTTRIQGLLGLPFSMQPAGRDARRDEAIAKAFEADFKKSVPETALIGLLRWGIMLGIGFGRVYFDRTASKVTPRIEVWHPQHLRFDWWSRQYLVQTMEGEKVVKPGDGWIVYEPFGRFSWMHGAVRGLALPWLARQYAIRDWARHNEVHGQPIRKAIVPIDGDPAEHKRFWQDVRDIANETTIRLPRDQDQRGYDVELLEAKENSYEAFERLITSVNVSIAVGLLGQNLTTEVQGGAYASTRVHDRIRVDYLQADADTLAAHLREQVNKPWARFQYGDPELAPCPHWDSRPAADHTGEAKAIEGLGKAVVAIDAVFEREGLQVDAVAMAQRFGIPTTQRKKGAKPLSGQSQRQDPKRADDMSDDERDDESKRKQDKE